jgi:hypothetical protein
MGGHQGHALTHFLFLVLMTSVVMVALRLPHLATLTFSPAGVAAAFPADVTAKSVVLLLFSNPKPGISLLSCIHPTASHNSTPVPISCSALFLLPWVCKAL